MIKFGIIGGGFISQNAHLPALQKADGVELKAIFDLAKDVVDQLAALYHIDGDFKDLDKFLENAEIDAVLVAVPDPQHLPVVEKCLKAGKHVLVEKPLTSTVKESEQLVRLVEKSGLKLQVGFMKRFDPGVEFAKKFIQNEMGDILALRCWYCDSTKRSQIQKAIMHPTIRSKIPTPPGPDQKANLKAYKLHAHGAHPVDMMRNLGGEITGLQAYLTEKNGNFSWQVMARFASGYFGSMELTVAVKMDWYEGFQIHGQNGDIVGQIGFPFNLMPAKVQVFDARSNQYLMPSAPDSDPYERQIEAFVGSIMKNQPVSPDVYDGLACQRILDAIATSVEQNRWVDL